MLPSASPSAGLAVTQDAMDEADPLRAIDLIIRLLTMMITIYLREGSGLNAIYAIHN